MVQSPELAERPAAPAAPAEAKEDPPDRRAAAGGRRQWGHDKRVRPIPVIAPRISDRRVGMGRLALILTVVAWIG